MLKIRRLFESMLVAALAIASQTAVAQTTVAGFTSGSFQVSESGGANYSIPIQVPPGIGGFQPNLALVYSSHSGNGLVGMGWTLQGLPTVERCGKTIVQDGVRTAVAYDASDRYCLNGQRLVGVAGTYGGTNGEYRTERESFARLFSFGSVGNGPTSFQVQTKSGLWMEFGSAGDSQIEAAGKASIRLYQVFRIRDASNNVINAFYNENETNGEYSPRIVWYAGNDTAGLTPVNSVGFVYETRSDPIYKNIAGSTVKITQRLKNIQTFAGTGMVKDYRLAYGTGSATGRSRLTSITECSGDGTQCFVAAQFAYTDHSSSGSQTWSGGVTQGSAGWRMANLFGDGRQVYYTHNGSGTHNGTRVNSDGTKQNWTWTGGSSTGACGCWEVADLFGDGTQVFHSHNSAGTHYATRLKSDGTVQNWTWTGGQSLGNTGRYELVDLFGDGKRVFYTYSTGGAHRATRLNSDGTVTNFSWTGAGPADANWRVADLFGDGRQVIYSYSGTTHAAQRLNSDGTMQNWTWTDSGFSVGSQGFRMVDLFGDGRDLFYTNWGNGTHSATRLNTDNTFQKFTWTGTASPGDAGWEMADVKGDGRQYYTTHSSAGAHTAIRFNADSTFQTYTWSDSVGAASGAWKLADVFGSGRYVFYTNASGTHKVSSIAPLASSTAPADLANQFPAGANGTTTVTYRPLTDSAVYTKDATATYPVMDLQAPIYVVKDSTVSDGMLSAQATYSYTGAKTHLTGGGFLGFRKFDVSNAVTGIKSSTTFRQDYPFNGLPLSAVKTQPSGGTLGQVTNTWTDTSYVNSWGKYHRTDLTQSVQSGSDLDGATWPTVTTSSTYDTYGNPLTVTSSTGDGFSKTTTSTFSNVVSSGTWQLGRLTSSSVASTIPGPSTQTRVSKFEYNSAGLLIREAIEPGNSNFCLVTTYVLDTYGNRTSATTRNCNGTSSGGLTEAAAPTGSAVFTSRTSTTQYQAGSVTINGTVYSYPAGQYPTTATNALTQSEARTFDPRFGGMLSVTGPNALSTSWTYDKFGRAATESRADGTSTSWSYALCGSAPNYCGLNATVTATGAPTSTSYSDRLGRVHRTETQGFDGTLVRKDTQYDSLGRVTQTSQPYLSTGSPVWTIFTYDILSRVKTTTDAAGAVTWRNYSGLVTSVVNPLNQMEQQFRNSQGQLYRVVRE